MRLDLLLVDLLRLRTLGQLGLVSDEVELVVGEVGGNLQILAEGPLGILQLPIVGLIEEPLQLVVVGLTVREQQIGFKSRRYEVAWLELRLVLVGDFDVDVFIEVGALVVGHTVGLAVRRETFAVDLAKIGEANDEVLVGLVGYLALADVVFKVVLVEPAAFCDISGDDSVFVVLGKSQIVSKPFLGEELETDLL